MPTFKETVSIGWKEGPYKKTLSKEELKVFKSLKRTQKDNVVLQYMRNKPIDLLQDDIVEKINQLIKNEFSIGQTETELLNVKEKENTFNEPRIIEEPEVYDFDNIVSKLREVSIYDKYGNVKPLTDETMEEDDRERHADLSPGEERYLKAQQRINTITAELTEVLTEMQRKHPNYKVATNYQDVEPNYHNQKYFDAIEQLTEGVDWDSLTPYEQKELEAKSAPYEYEILANQPTKATSNKPTSTRAKKDSKLVEYVRSVEDSLDKGVIDNDYAKQAIINYLEANL
ncbi:hypothetical protein BUY75_02490 [Staphylococcus epidermidis]|uniref:hypothetical protein n=1 Tax=Staphylococcus epidermidis TaxID=1282 RepID=UPI000D1C8B0E|nr:hypothetical protein [Staphylococcus epidermidis]PTE46829.1 hypothetical protein BUY75_02490 [Staphylococcus epidermidis]